MQLSVLLSALVSVTVFVAASPTPGVTSRSSYKKREELETNFIDYKVGSTGDRKREELETNFIDYKLGRPEKREELETNFIDYEVGLIGDKKREELETNFIDYKAGSTGGRINLLSFTIYASYICTRQEARGNSRTNFIDYKVGLIGDKKREELETNFIDYKAGSTGVGFNLLPFHYPIFVPEKRGTRQFMIPWVDGVDNLIIIIIYLYQQKRSRKFIARRWITLRLPFIIYLYNRKREGSRSTIDTRSGRVEREELETSFIDYKLGLTVDHDLD
ncbi:hypothetical protein EDB19DRAFT_1919161 [Suillus lakei]|nr:hypothetical protein EDB19DRAFT_1919161 [Suillus lakei]